MLCWIASTVLRSKEVPVAVDYLASVGESYEFVDDASLPLEAMPIVVTDRRGKAKWTVSISQSLEFPLNPSDYANICRRSDEISEKLQGIKGNSASTGGSFCYDRKDPNFIDVEEAVQDRLLPAASGGTTQLIRKPVALGEKEYPNEKQRLMQAERKDVCKRSLTYVLETADAGLGRTLMGLWMSYGLAKEENRAFFIDDTNWYYQRPHANLPQG